MSICWLVGGMVGWFVKISKTFSEKNKMNHRRNDQYSYLEKYRDSAGEHCDEINQQKSS